MLPNSHLEGAVLDLNPDGSDCLYWTKSVSFMGWHDRFERSVEKDHERSWNQRCVTYTLIRRLFQDTINNPSVKLLPWYEIANELIVLCQSLRFDICFTAWLLCFHLAKQQLQLWKGLGAKRRATLDVRIVESAWSVWRWRDHKSKPPRRHFQKPPTFHLDWIHSQPCCPGPAKRPQIDELFTFSSNVNCWLQSAIFRLWTCKNFGRRGSKIWFFRTIESSRKTESGSNPVIFQSLGLVKLVWTDGGEESEIVALGLGHELRLVRMDLQLRTSETLLRKDKQFRCTWEKQIKTTPNWISLPMPNWVAFNAD